MGWGEGVPLPGGGYPLFYLGGGHPLPGTPICILGRRATIPIKFFNFCDSKCVFWCILGPFWVLNWFCVVIRPDQDLVYANEVHGFGGHGPLPPPPLDPPLTRP